MKRPFNPDVQRMLFNIHATVFAIKWAGGVDAPYAFEQANRAAREWLAVWEETPEGSGIIADERNKSPRDGV